MSQLVRWDSWEVKALAASQFLADEADGSECVSSSADTGPSGSQACPEPAFLSIKRTSSFSAHSQLDTGVPAPPAMVPCAPAASCFNSALHHAALGAQLGPVLAHQLAAMAGLIGAQPPWCSSTTQPSPFALSAVLDSMHAQLYAQQLARQYQALLATPVQAAVPLAQQAVTCAPLASMQTPRRPSDLPSHRPNVSERAASTTCTGIASAASAQQQSLASLSVSNLLMPDELECHQGSGSVNPGLIVSLPGAAGCADKRKRMSYDGGADPKMMMGAGNRRNAGARVVCLNCGIAQTPQWRCGPEGPRTLCNACGVRFKKGLPLPYMLAKQKSVGSCEPLRSLQQHQ